ncbi:MAG: hypothetical protein LBM78_02170 [Clostridiales bacterium]|jgi:hypothetical protein|nr:hypothetical protein [Clostridiales bacterium]
MKKMKLLALAVALAAVFATAACGNAGSSVYEWNLANPLSPTIGNSESDSGKAVAAAKAAADAKAEADKKAADKKAAAEDARLKKIVTDALLEILAGTDGLGNLDLSKLSTDPVVEEEDETPAADPNDPNNLPTEDVKVC